MASVTELVTDVRAEIPEVPKIIAQKYLMRATRMFCQETRAWRVDFLVSTTATIATITLTSKFPSGTELVDIVSVKHTDGGAPVEPRTYNWLDKNLTDWRSDTALKANYYVLDGNNIMRLVPTPSTTVADAYDVRVAVQPLRTATTLDSVLTNRYDEDLINGTLALLYRIPRKPWTDLSLAQFYQVKFNDSMPRARSEAADEFQTGVPRKVRYGGL